MASTDESADPISSPSVLNDLAAIKYAHQSEKLSHLTQNMDRTTEESAAIRAEWITPHDPVIVTAGGNRLPGVPLEEAHILNDLREKTHAAEKFPASSEKTHPSGLNSSNIDENGRSLGHNQPLQKSVEGSLDKAMPPSRTNPLFPPLPLYGPPTIMRNIQCLIFRATSSVLSLAFLFVIILGAAFTSLPLMFEHIWLRLTFRDPDLRRPHIVEERRRKTLRKQAINSWKKKQARRKSHARSDDDDEDEAGEGDQFVPTEGGHDPIVCDVGYYARRVGLDMEEFKVQTEDGFIIRLWHIYNPKEYTPLPKEEREAKGPGLFTTNTQDSPNHAQTEKEWTPGKKPKLPVLMIHGLLQSSGAYCTNDDSSLAFYLCKQGYDIWLGNNRCGFDPEHTILKYNDPRMWAWNIRQMGVMDLPALTSRVLSQTGFSKLGLIAHSQGTTQTLVALAKEQRPDLGDRLTVFCALAPAAYAGPLIGKFYFKFMRIISPALFRLVFGIHAFIPFMMRMHQLLPPVFYGAMGYRVFAFLFGWTDTRWERDLRDRMFQFAPVYVSAESMRWWLGRECFAKHRCILATKEEGKWEDEVDNAPADLQDGSSAFRRKFKVESRGAKAWYDEHCPPFALWVAGQDKLVDGRRLLRRFEKGREPFVKVVHSKVIETYEHLDVVWAVDMIEQVGREVKEVLWKTCDVRENVRTPVGCEHIGVWEHVERNGGGGTDGGDTEATEAE